MKRNLILTALACGASLMLTPALHADATSDASSSASPSAHQCRHHHRKHHHKHGLVAPSPSPTVQ